MDNVQQQDLILKRKQLQKTMQAINADACLLTIDVNLYYLCGRIFNGYLYLPAEGDPCIFVKRGNEGPEDGIYTLRKPEQLPELLTANRYPLPRKLLLEADELSYNEYMRLARAFRPEEAGNASSLLRQMRMIKTPWEIGQMRLSAEAHMRTYNQIPECYRPGMTDLSLQFEIEYRMRKNGSIGLFKAYGNNMDIFMGSVLAGENAEIPSPFDFALGGAGIHPFAPLGANGTLLKEGMTVMIDMSGNYTAYQTDMTRTFTIGQIAEKARKAHELSIEIHRQIVSRTQPGRACSEIYQTVSRLVEKSGLSSCFMGTRQQAKFIGHGIGLQINELPVISPRSSDCLQPGMVFALEPKFVLPGTGATGIENTYLVTETGIENLTPLPEELKQLK